MLIMVTIIGYYRQRKKSPYEDGDDRDKQTFFHERTSIAIFYSWKHLLHIQLLIDRGSSAGDSSRQGASDVNPHSGEFWFTRMGTATRFCQWAFPLQFHRIRGPERSVVLQQEGNEIRPLPVSVMKFFQIVPTSEKSPEQVACLPSPC